MEFGCDFWVTRIVILNSVQLDWLTGDRSLGRVCANPNVDFSTAPQGTCPHELKRREAPHLPGVSFWFSAMRARIIGDWLKAEAQFLA
jgi:hypothetical protein